MPTAIVTPEGYIDLIRDSRGPLHKAAQSELFEEIP